MYTLPVHPDSPYPDGTSSGPLFTLHSLLLSPSLACIAIPVDVHGSMSSDVQSAFAQQLWKDYATRELYISVVDQNLIIFDRCSCNRNWSWL